MSRLRPAFVIFAAATLQGFAFTLVPALATVFSAAPYAIDASAFGSLFLALTLGAIAAAVTTPLLARRFGMLGVLRFGVAANIAALAALIASTALGSGTAYALLLADTTAIGFGLSVSAINELAATLSNDATRSITVANVLIGLGTALTPLFIGTLILRGMWPLWPALLVAGFAGVLVGSMGWTAQRSASRPSGAAHVPAQLVLFAVAALLYAFCEGAFSSWATSFVHDARRFSLETGERALAGFWFALTGTRALLAVVPIRAAATKLAFVFFPLTIAVTFLLLPTWTSPTGLIFGFVAGGVACSIVFPYAVSLALAALPGDADRTAAVMVAALITGEGIGTYLMGVLRTNAGLSLTQIYRVSACVAVTVAIAALLAVKMAPQHSEPAPRRGGS